MKKTIEEVVKIYKAEVLEFIKTKDDMSEEKVMEKFHTRKGMEKALGITDKEKKEIWDEIEKSI